MVEPMEPQSCKVALLAGGTSEEREVSLASGKGAKQALQQAGFQVTQLDPANKEDIKSLIDGDFDVAFICLHGKHGEDGALQGLLEVVGIPYTGSNVWSSALSMDKAKTKVFYERAGLKTPYSITLSSPGEMSAAEIVGLVGERCVVKPSAEGSSFGLYIVETEEELVAGLEKAFELASEVLVEKYIAGEEYTVAVLGNNEPYALPAIRIVPMNEFYDFESKYATGGSEHLCPAPLSQEKLDLIHNLAIKAHKVLGCSGVSRSDFILDDDGEFWLLETNTIPGMTETSLLPDAGRAAGMEFPELCTKLIEYALERSVKRA